MTMWIQERVGSYTFSKYIRVKGTLTTVVQPHNTYATIQIYMQNHNDETIKTSDTVLRKIYLSLY